MPQQGCSGMQVLGAAASGVASFAIDAQGCVWSWGTSKRGQLGQGAGIAEAARPARLPGLEGITSVACGWGHALALRGLHLPKMLAIQKSGSQKLHGRACDGSVETQLCSVCRLMGPSDMQQGCSENVGLACSHCFPCEDGATAFAIVWAVSTGVAMQRMAGCLHGATRRQAASVTSLTQAGARWGMCEPLSELVY